MLMFVDPLSFFFVKLTESKSNTFTSKFPWVIWMLMIISSFLIDVI